MAEGNSLGQILTLTLGVQLGVVALIAVFFLVLSASVRLVQVRLWAIGWVAQTVAIAASFQFVSAFPVGGEEPIPLSGRVLLALFATGKTAYALFLAAGTLHHFIPGASLWSPWRRLGLALAWGVPLGFWLSSPMLLLPLQWLAIAVILVSGALRALWYAQEKRSRWLGWILLGEGLLFLAYVPLQASVMMGGEPISGFFHYSSLFDAGADLLLALAVLVALESTRSGHLERLNQQLEHSHRRLRQLVDLDPMTGLTNRRGLRQYIDSLDGSEASVVFLDLDRFKEVNDLYGHAIGDLSLQRVADALREGFRPGDGLFRWGGDEFLIVAPGLSEEAAAERMGKIRETLRSNKDNTFTLTLSFGVSRLTRDSDVDAVLQKADARMYEDKRWRSGASRVAIQR